MNLYLVEKDRTKILSVDFFLLGNDELTFFLIDNSIMNIYYYKKRQKRSWYELKKMHPGKVRNIAAEGRSGMGKKAA